MAIVLVLVAFVAAGTYRYRSAQGDDLGSSYVGCRLVASGHADHLYSYDPANFAAVGPDEPDNQWQIAADDGEYESFLHPYVQTPLWAYVLQPICGRANFRAFEAIFVLLDMVCFAAFLWLTLRFWAPAYFHAAGVTLLALGLWFSEPFRYAMWLVQTHVLLMLFVLAGLILAERRRPGFAGLLLAVAAAVKITPAVLVLYWIFTRRWKAAASMVGWSALLAALTVWATGPQVMAAYLADLQRISRILLVSQNNQSFAAWAMGLMYPRSEVADFHMLPLPGVIRISSMCLMVGVTAAGGWIDRRLEQLGAPATYLGASMGLVAATLFAPIAWTHYSFILVVPLLVLAQQNIVLRSHALTAVLFFVAALNFPPLATNVEQMTIGRFSMVRGQFFAGVLCLGASAFAAWRRRDHLLAHKTRATARFTVAPEMVARRIA